MNDIKQNDDQPSVKTRVKVVFHRSRSTLYKRALSIAKSFPSYEEQGDTVCCSISDIYDLCRLQRSLHELMQIVAKWKSAEIWLSNRKYKTMYDYRNFLIQIKKYAGKYAPLIDESVSSVSLGNIAIEELPYPIVYYPDLYGAFFAFAKDIGEPIVFCECERTAIENYIKLREERPLIGYTSNEINLLGTDCFPTVVSQMSRGASDPLSLFSFKEGICFRCNKVVPSYSYCLPMYGGSFKQHYGWYIQQEFFKLGIDRYQMRELNVLEDVCDPETYDSLKRLSALQKKNYADSSMEEIREASELKKKIDQTVENSVRAQLGFRKIGDAWISETILYEIVCAFFKGDDVIRHYRPYWLDGLELDIFVPNHSIAFEYQGIQHFYPIEHWGGEKQLQKQKEHDARKKRICMERNIKLICINYDEPLTTEFVVNRINDMA